MRAAAVRIAPSARALTPTRAAPSAPVGAMADVAAAMCLIGLPRMLHAPQWWSYRREFLESLLLGGARAELFLVTSVLDFDAHRYCKLVSDAFAVPIRSVHAINHVESPAAAEARRCGTQGRGVLRGRSSAAAFYAQADKAKACYDRVLDRERARARRFEFIVRMRVDWLFQTGPALLTLRNDALVYARLRCFALPGSPRMLLPTPYMSFNFPTNASDVPATFHACGAPSKFLDDGFAIAPRPVAAALFEASALPCPHEDAGVLAFVESDCAGRHWPECYLQAALHRAPHRPLVGPIAVRWHFPGWRVMEQGCAGRACSWNHQPNESSTPTLRGH